MRCALSHSLDPSLYTTRIAHRVFVCVCIAIDIICRIENLFRCVSYDFACNRCPPSEWKTENNFHL